MSIFKYIVDPLSRLFKKEKTISRESLHEQLVNTNTALITHIKPSLLDTKNKLSKLTTNDRESETLLAIFTSIGINEKSVEEALDSLTKDIDEIIFTSNQMINMVSDFSPTYITNRNVSPRIAFVIHISNMITSIALFTPDLMLHLVDTAFDMDGMPKIRRTNVEENLVQYRVSLNYLRRDMIKVIKEAKELPEVTLDLLDTSTLTNFKNSHLIKNMPVDGFVGNPIYHFRKWLVDRDVEKFEAITLKTTLLKSKLEQLQMQSDKEDNPRVAKAIEYLEKEINQNDKELRRLQS